MFVPREKKDRDEIVGESKLQHKSYFPHVQRAAIIHIDEFDPFK